MKQCSIYLNILAILALCLLVACSTGGSAPGKMNCSNGGEVCVYLNTVQSFAIGSPVNLKITVTSSKDISDLNMTLNTGAEITLDGPQTWEKNITNPTIDRGIAYWNFAIKAGQTLTFTRVLHFSSKEGYHQIVVAVVNTGRIIDAEDEFYVLLTQAGGQVILAGTPLPPHTPNVTSAVYGPGTPVPTFLSASITPNPSVQFSPLVATSTPLTSPYPAPSAVPSSTSALSPTPVSSSYP